MDITQIDENFKIQTINEPDIEWFDPRQAPFSLHGVFYSEEEGKYRRMEKTAADETSYPVSVLSGCTAGGRVRFMTNSPYVAVKCVELYMKPSANGSNCNNFGFGIYASNVFRGTVHCGDTLGENKVDGKIAFEGKCNLLSGCLEEVCVHFPAYCDVVYAVYIGLKKGSVIQEPKSYAYPKPVVYYGSSITQGGCASHAGNDYPSVIARELDCDFINLGFSGSGKGEPRMAEYIATLDASVCVMDYDHNAPTVEHLQDTHYNFYEIIRKAKPQMPIILISRPNTDSAPEDAARRREVIKATYQRAKKQGDKRIWFINGETLFGKHERTSCTVEGTHPNDLGMYRMAQTIAPVLKKALKKSKK